MLGYRLAADGSHEQFADSRMIRCLHQLPVALRAAGGPRPQQGRKVQGAWVDSDLQGEEVAAAAPGRAAVVRL